MNSKQGARWEARLSRFSTMTESLSEWLHRDNYTVEELELMNFVGDEKPVIKKDGVKIIRDGTVIRRTNTETRKTEFLFIPRIITSEQKTV